MSKERKDFNIGFPESVNSENQEVKVCHGDSLGSYTGRGEDPYEKPVKDADDL